MRSLHQQKGFTLVEILISLAVALIILAGMTSVFVAQTRTATMLSGKTEAMGDLYLASQIMQSELRSAQAICWNAVSGLLVYQPLDSTTALAAACPAPAATNGSFEFRVVDITHPTPYICWNRPNDATGCQELLRNLTVGTGLSVTPVANANMQIMRTVVISSQYQGQDHTLKPLGLAFKVWPRN